MKSQAEREAEFALFVAERGERLVRAARLLTGDWHSGSDLAQETLIRLLRAWPRLRDVQAADQYARRIMVRLQAKQRRRRWRGELATGHLPDVAAPCRSHDPDEQLLVALRQLPVRQRTTVVLRFYLDMTVEATAEAMGCSAGTVKSQTSKALGHLRAELSEPDISKERVG